MPGINTNSFFGVLSDYRFQERENESPLIELLYRRKTHGTFTFGYSITSYTTNKIIKVERPIRPYVFITDETDHAND